MNTSKITTAKPKITGAVFSAPLGTPLPANSTAALNPAFKELGYLSEDGITNENSPSTETSRGWGGDIVLTYMSDKPDTFNFKLIESLNADVLKVVYNSDNVSVDSAGNIAIAAKAEEAEERSWVFDMILKNGAIKRIVIPKASISSIGTIAYKDTEISGYEIEITAIAVNGVSHNEYISGLSASGSASAEIKAFVIGTAIGVIDNVAHTITVEVPSGTSKAGLTPAVIVSEGATVSPASGASQNFTNPVVYTVTAEDGTTSQQYTVTVNVEE